MADVRLKKASASEAIKAFFDWDGDPRITEAYGNLFDLVEQAEEVPAGRLCEISFWAGVWYAKTHPEEVEINEDGSKKPTRPIAPTFV